MSNPSPFLDRIRQVFRPTQRGVVGLVDDLLGSCQKQELQLDWHDGQCRVRAIGAEPEESIEVPVSKSVFRAVLARLAALCNERKPASVSPYGGKGELTIGVDRATICSVAFTNTPDTQHLRLTRIQKDHEEGGRLSGKPLLPNEDGIYQGWLSYVNLKGNGEEGYRADSDPPHHTFPSIQAL
jgi:hypothetical protein